MSLVDGKMNANQTHILFSGRNSDYYKIYAILWCSKCDVDEINPNPFFIDGTLSPHSWLCNLSEKLCNKSETYFGFNGSSLKRFKCLDQAYEFIDNEGGLGGFIGEIDALKFNFNHFVVNLLAEAAKKTWYIGICKNDYKKLIIISNTKMVSWIPPNCGGPISFNDGEFTYDEVGDQIKKIITSVNQRISGKRKRSYNNDDDEFIPYFGKSSDWKYICTNDSNRKPRNCLEQIQKRRQWYNFLINEKNSKIEPDSRIVTLNGISFLYYEVLDPNFTKDIEEMRKIKLIPSYEKSLEECVKYSLDFLTKYKSNLWVTFTGKLEITIERKSKKIEHTQAVLFSFYKNNLEISIIDSNNYARKPMDVIIKFLSLINNQIEITIIDFVGSWGFSQLSDGCFITLYRVIANTIFTGKLDPPEIFESMYADEFFSRYIINDSEADSNSETEK